MPKKAPQSRHIRSSGGDASAARATSTPGPSSRGPGKTPIADRGRAAAGKRKARDRSASPERSHKRHRRMRKSESDDEDFELDSEDELDEDWQGKQIRTRVVKKNKENVQPARSAANRNVKGEAVRRIASKSKFKPKPKRKPTTKTPCPLACSQTFTRSADMERHLLYKHLKPRVLCKYPVHGGVPAALKRPDIVSRHMGKGGARGSCMGPAKFAALVREAGGCEREVLQKFVDIELPCVHEPEVARVVALLGQPDPWPRLMEKLEQYGTVVACKCEKCEAWFDQKAWLRAGARSAEPRASGSTVEAVRELTGTISEAEGEDVHTQQPKLPTPEFSDSAVEPGGLRTVVRGVGKKSMKTGPAKKSIHKQGVQIRDLSPHPTDVQEAQAASSPAAAAAEEDCAREDVLATAEFARQHEADMGSEYGQLQPGQVLPDENPLNEDLDWLLTGGA